MKKLTFRSITKLLSFCFLLTLGLVSCTEDSQELEIEPIEPIEIGSDAGELTVFKQFVIDGEITNDLTKVKAIFDNAYVKDFDYANEKLTLFTTEADYQYAVKSDSFWQKQEQQRTFEMTDSNENGSDETLAPATENTHYTNHNYEDHSDDLVVNYQWSSGFISGDFTITDMTNTRNYNMSVHANYSTGENVFVKSYSYYTLFNGARTSSNKVDLINTFGDRDVTVYLYKNTNYGGGYSRINLGQSTNSRSVTLSASKFTGGTTPNSFKVRYLLDRN